ncbi:MAG: YdcF family protein [Velocimicrobium sp.]
MNQEHVAHCINTLGAFCGRRDIPSLTPYELRKKYGFEQADIMVLFGGSIICGSDILANAMQKGIAKKYIIVGGVGHTTETLRIKMHQQFPEVTTAGLPEAKVFANYLKFKYKLEPDYLECSSTNCGNNITYLLDLLKEHHIVFRSIILCQDATMQLRMAASLRKYKPDITIVNYAAYLVDVVVRDNKLIYNEVPWGMWDMERYIALLTGEISRLSDDADGYGPKGKNYLVHVEVPQDVRNAFESLKEKYGDIVRKANPAKCTQTINEKEIDRVNIL